QSQNWAWFAIGIIIFLVILFAVVGDTYWLGGIGYNLNSVAPALLAVLIVLGILGFIIFGGPKTPITTR
ncbi:MAG: hypothetical protein AABW83_04225, partial [Nanoarchaeota archaeon]